MKRYDLMQDINTRGTFVVSKACIPHLKQAREPAHPHAVAAAQPRAAAGSAAHVAYTIAKYGMSLCTLGMAEEFARRRHRVQRALAAHDHRDRRGAEPARRRRGDAPRRASPRSSRTRPTRSSRGRAASAPGNIFLGEDVLAEEGVTDLAPYSYDGADGELIADLFVD